MQKRKKWNWEDTFPIIRAFFTSQPISKIGVLAAANFMIFMIGFMYYYRYYWNLDISIVPYLTIEDIILKGAEIITDFVSISFEYVIPFVQAPESLPNTMMLIAVALLIIIIFVELLAPVWPSAKATYLLIQCSSGSILLILIGLSQGAFQYIEDLKDVADGTCSYSVYYNGKPMFKFLENKQRDKIIFSEQRYKVVGVFDDSVIVALYRDSILFQKHNVLSSIYNRDKYEDKSNFIRF